MKRFLIVLSLVALAASAALPAVAARTAEETLVVFNNAMGGFDVEVEWADGTQKTEHIMFQRTATWQATSENPIVGMIATRDPVECRVHKRPLTGHWEIISNSRTCQIRQMANRRR